MEEELFETCRENRVDHLERLLQKPLDPNGQGLLLIAAQEGHLEVARLLLEAKADTGAADANVVTGATALHIAHCNGFAHMPRTTSWNFYDFCLMLGRTKMQQHLMGQRL